MRKRSVRAKDGSPLLMDMVNLHGPGYRSTALDVFSLLLSVFRFPEKTFYFL